jgi:hypothetical protein
MLRTSRVAAPEVLASERENLPYQKRCTAMPVAEKPCVSLHRLKQLKDHGAKARQGDKP